LKLKTDNIKSLIEQVVTELENINSFAASCEAKESDLTRLDFRLREREGELNKREAKLKEREDNIGAENDLIAGKLVDIEQRELLLAKLEGIRERVAKESEELDIKKVEIDQKSEGYDFLVKREKELKIQEDLINKEKLVDRERKEKLDIREYHLKKKEERLQMAASSV
jgi:hypothetical protein